MFTHELKVYMYVACNSNCLIEIEGFYRDHKQSCAQWYKLETRLLQTTPFLRVFVICMVVFTMLNICTILETQYSKMNDFWWLGSFNVIGDVTIR